MHAVNALAAGALDVELDFPPDDGVLLELLPPQPAAAIARTPSAATSLSDPLTVPPLRGRQVAAVQHRPFEPWGLAGGGPLCPAWSTREPGVPPGMIENL